MVYQIGDPGHLFPIEYLMEYCKKGRLLVPSCSIPRSSESNVLWNLWVG